MALALEKLQTSPADLELHPFPIFWSEMPYPIHDQKDLALQIDQTRPLKALPPIYNCSNPQHIRRKNVGKRMLEPIERRGLHDCYIAAHFVQHILDRLSVSVPKIGVQPKIKYRKLQLADHL